MIITQLINQIQSPFAIAFLPNGDLVFTQRDNSILSIVRRQQMAAIIGRQQRQASSPTPPTISTTVKQFQYIVPNNLELLGVAIDPNFNQNGYIYIVQTTSYLNGRTTNGNQVIRYVFDNAIQELREPTVLLSYDSNQSNNGGRLKFGPDGYLYLTTGNALNTNLPSDLTSNNGKILRFASDGSIPSDNPYLGLPVWASGLRNPLGMAWNGSQMYAADTGLLANDKIIRVVRGNDYSSDIPLLSSGDYESWQPTGIAIKNDTLYFGALGGIAGQTFGFESLNQTNISFNALTPSIKNYVGEYGGIWDVVVGLDGAIYFAADAGIFRLNT
jgi:glucose/arabinose dehydrogenase